MNGPNKFTIFSKAHSVVCGFDILILFAQREKPKVQNKVSSISHFFPNYYYYYYYFENNESI